MTDEIRNYPNIKERFMRKVIMWEGCWISRSKPVLNSGYAQFSYGKYGKTTAHRLSYILFKGDIPSGYVVCHSCDNKLCVNPDHLWLGSQKENLADMRLKKRANRPKKYSDECVDAVRQLYRTNIFTQKELGEAFGMDRSYVSQLVNRVKRG